jgi:hypothetical protein
MPYRQALRFLKSSTLHFMPGIIEKAAGCAVLVFCHAAPALAPKGELILQSYGRGHSDCREWTNGCAVCRRLAQVPVRPDRPWAGRGGVKIACSTPGIACQPGEIQCSEAQGK